MSNEVAFIIATYNRCSALQEALESFKKYSEPNIVDYRIVVVDNGSSDNTRTVIELFQATLPLSYVYEPNPGVSVARNSGAGAVEEGYLIFMDDDARISQEYFTVLNKVLKQNPEAFGGPIFPYYMAEKPRWFEDSFEIRIHYDCTGWIPSESEALLSSANMGFKVSFFNKIKGFDESLGPRANVFSLGEDSEIIVRTKAIGGKIYYHQELVMEHLVPDYKFNVPYHLYRSFHHGKSQAAMEKMDKALSYRDYSYNIEAVLGELDDLVNIEFKEAHIKHGDSSEVVFFKQLLPLTRILSRNHHLMLRAKKERTIVDKLIDLNLYTIRNYFQSIISLFKSQS